MKENVNGFERELKIAEAWDKTDSDPKKNYGIHGMDMRFYLKGPKGVIQFILYTNWHLPHNEKDLLRKMDEKHEDSHFVHALFCPMPADIGYHSPTPLYEGQTETSGCHLLEGGKCYYDGSSLYADTIYNIFVAGGDDALWAQLEKEYHERFVAKN